MVAVGRPPSLRVLTLTTWNAVGPWPERAAETAAWLDLLAPDIACFQEVVRAPLGAEAPRATAASWEGAEVDWLDPDGAGLDAFLSGLGAASGDTSLHPALDATAGGWHLAFAGLSLGDGLEVGVAVASRRPIDVEDRAELPHEEGATPFGASNPMLHVRTAGIDVVTAHLAAPPRFAALRQRQVVALDDFVASAAGPNAAMPPVVVFDGNAHPDADAIRFLTGLTTLVGRSTYYQEAWRVAGGDGPGTTWSARNPHTAANGAHDGRIDYVFVGDHWGRDDAAGRIESARVVCDRPLTTTLASEHYGLMAEVTWPTRPA